MKTLSIGGIKLKNPLFLSPMVDVSDLPYRLICRESGAGMAYVEMINIEAILHENDKTKRIMKTCKEDKPVGLQITSSKVSDFRKVIPHLQNKGYNLIDINCGCPSVRTLDNSSGSALLKAPKKIGNMIKVLKDAGFTTTAKIRLGFKKNNVLKIAKEIEKAGADALAIHARLAHHSNKIPADWSQIKKIKSQIGIPVIGNGDITNGKQAEEMLEIADGAMIARAAIGDPSIFNRILYYLKTGKEIQFAPEKNIGLLSKYVSYAEKYEMIDLHRIKSVGANFFRNFHGAAKMRALWMQQKDFLSIKAILIESKKGLNVS